MGKKIDKSAENLSLWWLGLPEWQKWLSAPFVLGGMIIIVFTAMILLVPFAIVAFPFMLSRLILSSMFDEINTAVKKG